MYLIMDNYGDYKEIMNYKQMYNLLIDEIVEDSKENYNEYDIITNNLEQLSQLAKDDFTNEKYVIDNLQTYGWTIININDIKKALNELREYAARNTNDIKVFDEIIKYIDEELK